jgi:hypothetical protein
VLKKGALPGVFVALLTAGCAGGEELSKEQYVSRLNAMCEDFSEREKKIGEAKTFDDLVEEGPRILAAYEEAIVEEVHKLKAPGEIAEPADRVVDLADQQLNVLGALVDAAQDNDFAKVRELDSENKRVNQEANWL